MNETVLGMALAYLTQFLTQSIRCSLGRKPINHQDLRFLLLRMQLNTDIAIKKYDTFFPKVFSCPMLLRTVSIILSTSLGYAHR